MRYLRRNPITQGVNSFLGQLQRENSFCDKPISQIIYTNESFSVDSGLRSQENRSIILKDRFCNLILQNIAYTAHLLNACVALFDEDFINELIIEFDRSQSEEVIAQTTGPDEVKVTLSSPFTLSGKQKCKNIAAKALEVLLSEDALGEPASKIVDRQYRYDVLYKKEMQTIFARDYEDFSDIFEWVGQTEESLQEDVAELLEDANEELEVIREGLNDPSVARGLTQGDLFEALGPALETSEQIQVDGELRSLDEIPSPQVDAPSEDFAWLEEYFEEPPETELEAPTSPLLSVDAPSEDLAFLDELIEEPLETELEAPTSSLLSVDAPSEDLAFLDELIEDTPEPELEEPVSRFSPEVTEELNEIIEEAIQKNRDKIEHIRYIQDTFGRKPPIKHIRRKTTSKLPKQRKIERKGDSKTPRKISKPSREVLSETWDFGGFSANKEKGNVLGSVRNPLVSKLFKQVLPNLANFLNIEGNYTFELRATNSLNVSVKALPQNQKLIITVPKAGNVDTEDLLNKLAVSLDELFFNNEYSYNLDPETLLMEIVSFL